AVGESARRVPRFEPLGVERFAGALAFRRPADWSGRLATIPGTDPITEEAFVRAWGTLPAEPLTLSGTTRFLRTPALAVRTGPLGRRPSSDKSGCAAGCPSPPIL